MDLTVKRDVLLEVVSVYSVMLCNSRPIEMVVESRQQPLHAGSKFATSLVVSLAGYKDSRASPRMRLLGVLRLPALGVTGPLTLLL